MIRELAGVVIVAPQIHTWSGAVKVCRELDLEDAKGKLPPIDLVSDGQKRLLHPRHLAPLKDTPRKAAERCLDKQGFRLINGFAVPEQATDVVQQSLGALKADFGRALDELCRNLDAYYAQWETDHPGWEAILRHRRPSAAEVRSRCSFDWVMYRPAPVTSDLTDPTNQGLVRAGQGALSALLDSIALSAERIWQASYRGKSRVKASALRPLRQLVSKLAGFGVLDTRIVPAARGMLDLIDQLPREGTLTESNTTAAAGLILQLQDPVRLLDHGGAVHRAGAAHDSSQLDIELELDPSLPLSLPPAVVAPSSGRSLFGHLFRPAAD